MSDSEKVFAGLTMLADIKNDDTCEGLKCCKIAEDALALLKEQEELINELLELGYPHNFQHEAPWIVDYLYSLTEIIKKAFKAKEGR